MLAHKIEKRIVESKEEVLICDKCGAVIKTNSFYREFEYKITHTAGFLGIGKKQEFDLCESCSKELVEQLSKHEFLFAKPSDKELVEKLTLREINHD